MESWDWNAAARRAGAERERRDNVVVSAGYIVGPFDVESVLLEHPLKDDVACVGEPDERKGQVVAAHVVLGTEAEGPTEELRQWVDERLGRYAAPCRVHVHSTLPRTESGKIKRKELAPSLKMRLEPPDRDESDDSH